MEGLIKFLKPTTKLHYIFVRSKSFYTESGNKPAEVVCRCIEAKFTPSMPIHEGLPPICSFGHVFLRFEKTKAPIGKKRVVRR